MPRRFVFGISLAIVTAILAAPVLFAIPKAPPIEEKVHEMILDNGLKIVVAERHESPVFFTLSSFRVGSCQELPNRSGLAHFLEHMLFKGTKTLGTKDYKAEAPIMEQMEAIAMKIRDNMTVMQAWRYDKFEEYSLKVRSGLPQELLDQAAGDEALLWKALLDQLPKDASGLPEELALSPWIISDSEANYWALYHDIIAYRVDIANLFKEQKQYINEEENLDGIYDVRGSAMINAFTTEDQTTYMLGLPSNCLELWMYLESDRFQNAVFRGFYSEREVIMEELRNHENEPSSVLYYKFIGTAFDGHPYGRPVIGWLGDVRSTLKSDMENFYWKYYTPNNCQITIVGDVKTEEVFKLAKKYFGTWKKGEPSPAVTIIEPDPMGERRISVKLDAEPKIYIGYHVPVTPHPDAYALSIAQSILAGGKTSRFYKNIFEKGLTAGSPGADDGPSTRYPNLFMVNANPKAPHTTEEVELALYAEIERLKNEPVSEWELERVKNHIRVGELNRFASNQWMAFTLSSQFIQTGQWRNLKDDYTRRLSVTPEDIQRVAKKYLVPENRVVATLVKAESEQANAQQLEGAR